MLPHSDLLSRVKPPLYAVAGFSLVINLLMLTGSVYMMQVFDRVLTSQSMPTLFYLTLMASAALAVVGMLDYLRAQILIRTGSWLDTALGGLTLTRSLENAASGRSYRSQALRDLTALRAFIGGGAILTLFDAPWAPIYLAVVYLLHPWLGHVALAGAILLLLCAAVNHWLTAERIRAASSQQAKGFTQVEAAFRNAEVIDSMAMTPALAKHWQGVNRRVLQLQQEASDTTSLLTAISKFLRLLLQILILAAGAFLVTRHELGAGGMTAASIIMARALAPVEQSISTWKQLVTTRESWKRLRTLINQPSLHPESMPLPRPRGQLTVENVSFTPHGALAPVVQGLTLDAQPGEALAIIGPSAAGKSVLARLMVGLCRPQTGAVRLDGAEIFDMHRPDAGDFIGYMPQDVELFPGTIRQNIARMAEGCPERVVAAAALAGVHEMILRMPRGYETDVGEAGGLLSGGQRQRIGLARAVYGEPVLVVLDEPNASLDAAGEEALNGAVSALKAKGTTIVIVAHRPSLLAQVDKIALLLDGQLKAFGPRDAVLNHLKQTQAARPTTASKPQVSVVR